MKRIIALIVSFLIVFSVSAGFAQVSASEDDYALTFFKKLNKTQTKLTYMNKSGSLEKIGTETVNGNISGTLFYDVKIKGMGAVVTIRYSNYCDEDGWIFDGEILTHSNMAQNGSFEGTIKIKGIAPGEVCYDKVIMKKGAPADGFYLVKVGDKSPAKVDYKVYLKSKE